MPKIVREYTHVFSMKTMLAFQERARVVHDHKYKRGTHRNPAGKGINSLKTLTLGFASEWWCHSLLPGSVWSNAVERFVNLPFDVVWRGWTIDVKFVYRQDRSCWVKEANGVTSDLIVLAVQPAPASLAIREWITRKEFERRQYRYKPYADRPAVMQVDKRHTRPFKDIFNLRPKGVDQGALI